MSVTFALTQITEIKKRLDEIEGRVEGKNEIIENKVVEKKEVFENETKQECDHYYEILIKSYYSFLPGKKYYYGFKFTCQKCDVTFELDESELITILTKGAQKSTKIIINELKDGEKNN